jgi:hypothetical protein
METSQVQNNETNKEKEQPQSTENQPASDKPKIKRRFVGKKTITQKTTTTSSDGAIVTSLFTICELELINSI